MITPIAPLRRWWRRLFYSLAALLVFLCPGTAQIGWHMDPYAGINAAQLQPAATVQTPYGFDFNLGAFGVGVTNNYAFLGRASVLRTSQDAMLADVIYYDDEARLLEINGRRYEYGFREGIKERYARIRARILGPSFSFAVGENWRVGVFTALRGAVSMPGVDGNFTYPEYDALRYGTQFPVDQQMQGAGATWGEVGLHLAHAWGDGYQRSSLGVNLRYLMPVGGFYASSAGDAAFIKVAPDSVGLVNADLEVGFTREVDRAQHHGMALDLGWQTAWDAHADGTYRWTVGASLLDIGRLGFRGQAEVYRFTGRDTVFLASSDYPTEFNGEESIDPFLEAFQGSFTTSSELRPTANEFNVLLPMAFSGQVSYSPVPGLQLQALFVGDIPLGERAIRRGNALSFIPRWSRYWYGASLPVTLFDGRQVNVGAQLRLGPLVVGTDRLLGTLLPTRRFDSANFYVALKLFSFGTGNGARKQRRSRGRGLFSGGGGKGVECYRF